MNRNELKSDPTSGVTCGYFRFDNPTLADWRFPVIECQGARPGPRLCIQGGVHVNEVSSIEAAIRLGRYFTRERLSGSVSIIPIVNQPAMFEYTQYNCPLDDKNINFTFPGKPEGTFSEALCHALLFEWARDADVHVDLHGGDLREEVSHFVMFQRTGDSASDSRREGLARCFDADIVMGFGPEHMDGAGRAISALASEGRDAVMSEAGANGVIEESCVAFHVVGVINIARRLGMIDEPASPPLRRNVLCHQYVWIPCPDEGLFHAEVRPAEKVVEGQRLGVVIDVFGRRIGELASPRDGYVLWIMTHPVLRASDPAMAIAVTAE